MDRPIDRRRFLRRIGGAAAMAALAEHLPAADEAPLRIYIAVDDHTDYLWSADAETYHKAFVEMIDYYLDQADRTAADPPEYQGRFCCDGSLWMWIYEHHRTPAQFRRLIDRIKDGHVNVPLTPLVMVPGGAPAEAVLRGMYYAGTVERRFGLRLPVARIVENQVLPYGLGSLFAGAGAKYCWHGICSCATRVPNAARLKRQHEVYWWQGRDGRRVLMKWYSMWGGNDGLGGYAEARKPAAAIEFVSTSRAFRQHHPWRVVGIFGKGWDDLKTLTDEFVRVAREKTTARRKVIVSNEVDYFEDFEKTHGRELPTFCAAFGNEWDVLTASLAEPTASVKRSAEKLRAAEAMATLVAQKRGDFMAGREKARQAAWMSFGLYYEHDWTADGRISRKDRAAWSRRLAGDIAAYVDTLHDDAAAALAGMVRTSGKARRFYAFNPLSWRRTDVVDLPLGDARPVHAIDLATGNEAPSQIVRREGKAVLRVLASDLPPVGYKVFELRPGAGSLAAGGPSARAGGLENRFYRLTVAGRGAITSLLDKARGGRELVRTIRRLAANDLGGGTGKVEVEDAGAVSATLKVTADGPPVKRVTRITLYRDLPRIDIRNEIVEGFSDVLTWAFSFDLTDPDVRHEEVGAILRAKLLEHGGHYSPINARYDWLTLNHFVDLSGREGGVTISSGDCCFFGLGESTNLRLDTATPQVRVLAGGQVDGKRLGIPDQGGDTHFLQRFALGPHGAYDEPAAMRFALEHQNPPVARWLTGGGELPETSFGLLTIDRPDVLLWALKPSDDDPRRAVGRLWNLGAERTPFALNWHGAPIAAAREATHIETPLGQAQVRGGALAESIAAHEMKTYIWGPSSPAV